MEVFSGKIKSCVPNVEKNPESENFWSEHPLKSLF